VTPVADSSPLVVLAKLSRFDLLNRLFQCICISQQVWNEIVIAGAGLPGSSEVASATWIETKELRRERDLASEQQAYGLGPGEMSAILLAEELGAGPLLIDDYRARKPAISRGLAVLGTVGLLEAFYVRGYLSDLRSAFEKMTIENAYIDRRILNRRLQALGLPSL